MVSKGVQELRAIVQGVVGSGDTIEAEQVIDSLIKSMGSEGLKLRKEQAISQLQGELGNDGFQRKLEETINNMVGRYGSDRLPEIACADAGDIPTDSQLDALYNDIPEVIKEVPDPYLNALYYHKMNKPPTTSPHTGDVRELILASVLAAVSSGASYLTVSYPPQVFLDNVLRIDDSVTRESFYTTVKEAMEQPQPFVQTCMTCASKHQDDYKEMVNDYRELVASQGIASNVVESSMEESVEETVEEEPKVVKQKSASKKKSGGFLGALKGFGKTLTSMITSVFGNREKHKKTLTSAANKFAESTGKLTAKAGKKMLLLWKIVAGVNIVAFLARCVTVILTFFVDVTGRKTEAVKSGLAKIPLIGGLLGKGAKAVSASAIRSSLLLGNLPWLIALAVLTVFSIRVLSHKTSGEKDNIFMMLMSLLVIVATTISVVCLVKIGFATFKAFQDMEYFWATFYDNL